MKKISGLILEIFSQKKNQLKMSLSEKEEFTASLKTYSECTINPQATEKISQEITTILNKQDKKSHIGEESLLELKKAGQLLYDQLLTRVIKERLKNESLIDLILTVDEKLISIPWELLYDGRDFLCLKFNLGRLIRTEREIKLPQYRELSYPLKMLIIANPTGDLNSSYQEGLHIKNYLTKSKLINVNFKAYDVDTIYLKKNLRDYDIIHFAGHCEYNSRKFSTSGWVLSDGRMELEDFQLMAQTQALPSVIFANACQSAKAGITFVDPNRQGYIYNMAYALLFSGVRHYIGSSFRLDDTLAFQLAREFYTQIIEGKSIGEALSHARINLIKKYSYDTVAWGSYILYGDPSFVLSKPKPKAVIFPRRKLRLSKRKTIGLCLAIPVIALGLFLYNILPTINPSTYFLFSKARQFYLEGDNQKVFNLAQSIINKDALYLPVYKMLGDIYFRLGDMSTALQQYFDYSRFSEKKKDYKNLASAYIKIAWVYHMNGNYPKAEEFYNRAIELSRKNKDKLNEADGLSRLAVWYMDKVDYEKAFALLMQSSEINRQRQRNSEHKFNLACDYFNIAFLYVEKDNYKVAKEFYEKSANLFEELEEIPELSDYYFNMGEIALLQKEYQKALDYYNKGLELDKKLDHRFNLSSDYLMIGELYWEMGRFAEAERDFQQSILLCKQINNLPILAWVYYDLGSMYNEMGQKDKAKEFYRQALQIFKNIDTPDYQDVHQEYLALE